MRPGKPRLSIVCNFSLNVYSICNLLAVVGVCQAASQLQIHFTCLHAAILLFFDNFPLLFIVFIKVNRQLSLLLFITTYNNYKDYMNLFIPRTVCSESTCYIRFVKRKTYNSRDLKSNPPLWTKYTHGTFSEECSELVRNNEEIYRQIHTGFMDKKCLRGKSRLHKTVRLHQFPALHTAVRQQKEYSVTENKVTCSAQCGKVKRKPENAL